MQDLDITNIGTWLQDNKDVTFRLLVYKKVYTPLEQEKKYSDESEYENGGYYKYVKIVKAIEIPNDVLLEVSPVKYNDFEEEIGVYNLSEFYRLSEIRLSRIGEDDGEGN